MSEIAVPSRRKRLRFGALSAEDERAALKKNFHPLADFTGVRDGSQTIILGPKGAGKTALRFWLLDQSQQDQDKWIDISPDGIAWANVLRYADCGIAPAQAKKVAWLSLFIKECLSVLDDTKGAKHVAQEIQSILEANGFQPGKAGWGLQRVGLTVAGISMDFGRENVSPSADIGQMVSVLNACLDLIDEVLRTEGYRVRFVIDRLDEHWHGDSAEDLTLEGLLLAVKELGYRDGKMRAQVFLRTDIWERLVFHDKDKFKSQLLRIHWSERDLLALLAQRIRGSTGLSTSKDEFVVNWAFERHVKGVRGHAGQRATIRYMLDHIQQRPRDLVLLCELARKNRRHPDEKISATEILSAVEEYFHERLDNIQNAEAGQTAPELARLLQGLKGARAKITWKTLSQKIRESSPEFEGQEDKLRRLLLEYGVIGFMKPSPTFYSDDPHVLQRDVRQDTTFLFHPSLRISMSIKGTYGGAE